MADKWYFFCLWKAKEGISFEGADFSNTGEKKQESYLRILGRISSIIFIFPFTIKKTKTFLVIDQFFDTGFLSEKNSKNTEPTKTQI